MPTPVRGRFNSVATRQVWTLTATLEFDWYNGRDVDFFILCAVFYAVVPGGVLAG